MSTKSELSLTESMSKTSIESTESDSSTSTPTSIHSAPSSTSASSSSDKSEVNRDNREGLGKLLTKVMGADVTTITIPVTVCEPISFLMKLAEAIQYNDLLDKAAKAEDSLERLLYVSAFACSVWVSTERQAKPFNPLLGETYEYTRPQDNFRFFAEQVSHHPPIGACIAENDHWKFWQTQSLKTRFTGNSLECQGTGSSHVLLKKTGEHYKWDPVKTIVHNLIIGKIWVDNFGDITVSCKTTGEKAKIKMKECGWFSKNWRELEGDILEKDGKPAMHIWGKYNESISVAQSEEAKQDSKKDDKNARKKRFKDLKLSQNNEVVWQHTAKPLPANKLPSKYANDFTEFTMDLIRLDDNMRSYLPPTDSRLRTDRLALEKGDTKTASNEKHALEERQREARKKREKEGTAWVPKYFKLKKDEDGQDFYEYQGGYWEEREGKMKAAGQL